MREKGRRLGGIAAGVARRVVGLMTDLTYFTFISLVPSPTP